MLSLGTGTTARTSWTERDQVIIVARMKRVKAKTRVDYHKNGALKAKGELVDGLLHGYWEWFRIDGSKMRSGYFEHGQQVGEWTTYADDGRVVKVTHMKAKSVKGRGV